MSTSDLQRLAELEAAPGSNSIPNLPCACEGVVGPNGASGMIFLDHQATTPLDPAVLDAMLPWMKAPYNAHAQEHGLGRAAARAVENARESVAKLLRCEDSEITFTSGATEASNIVLRGLTSSGDTVVVSALEHASIAETARALRGYGRSMRRVAVSPDGILDLDSFETELAEGAALASIMTVSNEIGTVQPIDEVALLCQEYGVSLHSDITQAIGRISFALDVTPVTYASVSSHKIYGPQGVGALFVRKGTPAPQPLATGGGQERGLRPGTLPVAACVGFGVACDLASAQREGDFDHAKHLAKVMLEGLLGLQGWQVNGSLEQRVPHNLSIAFEGVKADILLASLPELALSTGAACSAGSLKTSETLKAIGLSDELADATVRIGFGRTTTVAEVETAAKILCDRVAHVRSIVP